MNPMPLRPTQLLFAVVFIVLCGLVGFTGYAALRYHNLYITASHSLQNASGSDQTATLYGTITSFDSTKGILEFERLSPYAPGTTVTSRVTINPRMYIARQTLLKEGDTYTGLAKFEDVSADQAAVLVPGTHIKVIVLPGQPNNVATYLLVGDPL